VDLGESEGVGCSSGLIDLSVSRSFCSCLSGIATYRGDSCRFPVMGDGCVLDQLGGPFLLTDGSSSIRGCLGKGVVRMGGICGSQDDDATRGEGSISGENSFRFPVTGRAWTLVHAREVGLLAGGSSSVRELLGNKGVVRLGVIETIRGNCNEDTTGVGGCKVILGKGGTSYGSRMRLSEEGAVFLTVGSGMFSIGWLTGTVVGKDRGNGMLTRLGVSSIGIGGS